ncbi:DUF4276 family protein [Polyangium aurulentum]|uniref:DUF4276 family protein n=1 Tax=Polyangium aurulentum TaxID=2567896 RepID=UPI0010AE37D3|nr:DUF4276 family protein [Polyangium aurulentum]UQA60077.1 DUF4276 family protein [Polyangium aurulentum]
MIYLRAGLFAEGPSDYQFLCPLLDRLIDTLAASLFAGGYELGATMGIDAPQGMSGGRAEKIAAAVAEHAELCELFVIHEDGGGDHEAARRTCIDPGLAAARAAQTGRDVIGVACIPVREIEAWMLADPEPFRTVLGKSATPSLPQDPERETDPKATLRRILKEGGARRTESIHAIFGERVGVDALRSLPAFQRFENELSDALQKVATVQRRRP